MIRSAFLKRMAFAALACGFLDVRLPEIESEPEFAALGYGGHEYYVREYSRLFLGRPNPARPLRGIVEP